MKNGGCWIFLSHSSHDIEKVRQVRNEFERQGQNPLAFHLKCLNADTPEGRQELDTLIKREIDSREWFVFCESPAARASAYVQMEKDYIFSTGKKKIWAIDMTLPTEDILKRVRQICVDIRVFFSYSRKDIAFAQKIEEALLQKDYAVFSDKNLSFGENGEEQVKKELDDAAEHGFCLLLLSEHYIESPACMAELKAALSSQGNIIPILMGNTKRPKELERTPCFSLPEVPKDEDLHLIVELIEEKLKSGIKGPFKRQASLYNKLCEIHEKLNYQKRYHAQEAKLSFTTGPMDDYCEIYTFPCCGKSVFVGDGPVSRFRADGCCQDDKTKP